MAEQLHLGDGVLHVHGLDGEALHADHVVIGLLIHGLDGLGGLGGFGAGLPDLLAHLGAIAADLAFQLVHGAVDGEVHVVAVLLGAQDQAVDAHGDFRDIPAAALLLKAHDGFGLLGEVALQLGKLLFGPGLEAVRNHVFAGIDKLHFHRSFISK